MPTSDIINDIKTVLDISSRVDERVKMIQSNQQELNAHVRSLTVEMTAVAARVAVLESKSGNRLSEVEDDLGEVQRRIERIDHAGTAVFREAMADMERMMAAVRADHNGLLSRVHILENRHEGWQSRWRHYANLLIQGIWVVIVCYILYRLGINTPPLP